MRRGQHSLECGEGKEVCDKRNSTIRKLSSDEKGQNTADGIGRLLVAGALVRLLLVVYAHFHDQWFRVKYTDIDYMIVVDGAREMWSGNSPFDRTTFRYTPLLAMLALPSVLVANPIGKLIFTSCDLGAAYHCHRVLLNFTTQQSAKWMISLFIIFNPIVLSVSTRGNSDMLLTFMSLLVLSKFWQKKYYQAAAILGFAVHFKIYPVIYVLPLVLGVWQQTEGTSNSVLKRIVYVGCVVFTCGIVTLLSFAVPTVLCYAAYGQKYINEAFIYHIYREDHRHNFSPYWLLMYLNMTRQHLGLEGNYSTGLMAFVPQAVVLLFTSYKLRRNVAHACCIETILFVAFNKVCTVQYFVWFIPLLAFIFCEQRSATGEKLQLDAVSGPRLWKTVTVMLSWAATIPLWVFTAIPLEFHGYSDFARLWLVSCAFFLTMVVMASMMARKALAAQRHALYERMKMKRA
ncbi:putative mannosyltransferase [Trypanosoma vivax]|nr:putative mannosyltransferase [Trypanosoma vivax]